MFWPKNDGKKVAKRREVHPAFEGGDGAREDARRRKTF
jgi:hypothetical protein